MDKAIAACVALLLASVPVVTHAAPPTTVAPKSVDVAVQARTGRPQLHVQVRGRGTVGLYRLPMSAAESRPTLVCEAPCDRVVDGSEGAEFVLDGPRMSPSLSFLLVDKPAALTIDVRPGYKPLLVGGWVVLAVGAAALVAGAITLTLADDDRTLRRAGGLTMLGSLPLLGAGGVMASFGRTRHRFVAR